MLETAALFLAMMIPLVWSPGPNNVMCATVGAKQRIKGSAPFILGLNTPIFIYSILTGLGLSVVLSKSPQTASFFSVLGAIYVVYLGLSLIRSSSGSEVDRVQYGFKAGLVISSLNFKVVTVLVVMYSQFPNETFTSSALLSVCFVLVCLVGHLLWSTVGQISDQLIKNQDFLRKQNLVYGAMLLSVGVWMLYSGLGHLLD